VFLAAAVSLEGLDFAKCGVSQECIPLLAGLSKCIHSDFTFLSNSDIHLSRVDSAID
jgi:hypothetical protein